MQVVLLRVGIDSGDGGIQGPLFRDGSFELIPIPDRFRGRGADERTYGNTKGRHGCPMIEYFPTRLWEKMRKQSMHVDPEFETFTYGDPTRPKQGLRRLKKGDVLVFYAGLTGYDLNSDAALYIIGYFVVEEAGHAKLLEKKLGARKLERLFRKNFHVRHRQVFKKQKRRLVLVKGGKGSRLVKKAVLISSVGRDKNGRPLKVVSPAMRRIFSDFRGHVSIQRSPPRWVEPAFVERAARFVQGLR